MPIKSTPLRTCKSAGRVAQARNMNRTQVSLHIHRSSCLLHSKLYWQRTGLYALTYVLTAFARVECRGCMRQCQKSGSLERESYDRVTANDAGNRDPVRTRGSKEEAPVEPQPGLALPWNHAHAPGIRILKPKRHPLLGL